MMRQILAIVAIAGGTLIGGNSGAVAYEAPWCVKAAVGGRSVVDYCYYRTLAQCNQARFDYFSTAFCVQNPRYVDYAPPRQRRP